MKFQPCIICGSSDYRLYLYRAYKMGDRIFDLIRCSQCGLVRVEPMPSADEVRRLYTSNYFKQDFSCGVRKGTYLESEAMRVGEYRELLKDIQSYRPSGKLLEVGCAAGSFLNYARRSGYEVLGVDVSEWAARTAKEQFGLEVRVGRLMEVDLPYRSFDVIFLGDLLEHEPEPLVLLEEVRRLLKPEGIVAVKVPTYVNSFYYRVARTMAVSWIIRRVNVRLLQAMKLFHQGPVLPPYHLYEYSRQNLVELYNKAGLNEIGHRTSLLVPEFLDSWNAAAVDRVILLGFLALRWVVVSLNIPAGHVLVFARKT